MRLPVIWTRPAGRHLADLHRHISQDSPTAAEDQAALIFERTRGLADFPESGRAGRVEGTRELVISGTPYIVVYRIRLSSVRVLAVMHGARRWPRRFR